MNRAEEQVSAGGRLPHTEDGTRASGEPSGRVYRIRVEGLVHDDWSSRLGGLRLTSAQRSEPNQTEITSLEGRLADRASLMGVLNTLHDLNLTLVSVETLENGNAAVGNSFQETEI